jgi:altronate dehydratase small subunit
VNAALVISDRDNVATALEALEPGRLVDLGGRQILIGERIPSGHKLALVDIAAGEPIVKYGSPIGKASVDIRQGTHVHTHNLESTRGRGDLAATSDPQVSRLAEPIDPPEESESAPAAGMGVGPHANEEKTAAARASGGGAPRATKEKTTS